MGFNNSESTISRGAAGERAAEEYLKEKGYRLLTRNWRCKAGEIDLVMVAPGTAVRVLVEVRTRQETTYGSGAETVFWQKQQKLLRAAQFYQQKEDWWGDVRFDVVAVTLHRDGSHTVEHVEHAFGQ